MKFVHRDLLARARNCPRIDSSSHSFPTMRKYNIRTHVRVIGLKTDEPEGLVSPGGRQRIMNEEKELVARAPGLFM